MTKNIKTDTTHNGKQYLQILLKLTPLLSIIYFLSMIFLGISWVGFWTDVLCSVILIYFSYKSVTTFEDTVTRVFVYGLSSLYIIIFIIWSFGMLMVQPFNDENYYYIKMDDRLFNAYASHTASLPSRSNLLITETFIFCPFLEVNKFYIDNFYDFDGNKAEKMSTLKHYIENEIIDKDR